MNFGSQIESIGIKLPELRVSSKLITDSMKLVPPIKLELISGIKERRYCKGKEDTFSLAIGAANDCFNYSTYTPQDIEMIIFCGISKLDSNLNYYYEPSISSTIARELKLNNPLSFDILNACAGMVTGIHIANNYLNNGIVKNCMVVSGEFISSISNNAVKNMVTHFSQELASLTLGDAGTAIILDQTSVENGIELLSLQTYAQYSKLCIAKLSNKYPGAQMFTQMQKLFNSSIKESPKFLDDRLCEVGLNYQDIDYIIPHQTSKRAIVSGAVSFRKYFKSQPKEVINNIELSGNTASTTHFLALYKLLQENKLKRNDRILLLSLASGLVLGAIVLKPNKLIDKYGQ